MLVHRVGAIGDEQSVAVDVVGQRLESDLEPFDDVYGTAGGGRWTDRHVEVDAIVGQEGLHGLPVAFRKRSPQTENGGGDVGHQVIKHSRSTSINYGTTSNRAD